MTVEDPPSETVEMIKIIWIIEAKNEPSLPHSHESPTYHIDDTGPYNTTQLQRLADNSMEQWSK